MHAKGDRTIQDLQEKVYCAIPDMISEKRQLPHHLLAQDIHVSR